MRPASLLLALLLALPTPGHAKPKPPPDHWVGTWSTASVPADNPGTHFGPPGAIGTTGTSGTTLREIVHVSQGGPLVRIVFTNEFGTAPLTIAAAHAALRAKPKPGAKVEASEIQLASANALTFAGQPSVTIAPGATATSDPFALELPPAADLAISFYLPEQSIPRLTLHPAAFQTSFYTAGNAVGASKLNAPLTISSWDFLKSVEVMLPHTTAAIVAFGDSITDGHGSTPNANNRWTDVLTARLQADKKLHVFSVLNEGIGGNRILEDDFGPSALTRFDRDVLAQPAVRYLILLEGINDIGRATQPNGLGAVAPPAGLAQKLIDALTQLTERAHAKAIKVLGATLTPYFGAGYFSPAGEAIRQQVNTFIRTSKLFDGVIDFDRATADPEHPTALRPAFDQGDHLHPSDAGYKAMGEAIDLTLFQPR